MKKLWKNGLAGEQRGAFIVFTALAVWFLMMFVAFAVDFGNYYQHRSRLQNAADAAALAGVARYADSDMGIYTTTEGKGRLIQIPSVAKEDSGAATFSNDSYQFTKLDSVPSSVHERAEGYVQSDYVQGDSARSDVVMDDSVWSATQTTTESTETSATAGGATEITTTSSTPKQYCYRVDLEDTINTFFARLFGVDTLSVKVSAMAMLDGSESATVTETLLNVGGHLSDIIPNYVWETIYEKPGTITDTKTGQTEVTQKFEKNDYRYWTSDLQVDNTPVVSGMPELLDDGNGFIIGYKDSVDGICADPIYADASVTEDELAEFVGTMIYTFDEKETQTTYQGQTVDILGYFLDRDNVGNSGTYGNWLGARERFTVINIEKFAGINPNRPFFCRIESEPIQIGAHGLTTVHGIVINVNLKEEELNSEKVKPVVIAYDGPDPNRGMYDAPWIATKRFKFDIPGELFYSSDYHAGQIRADIEPLLKAAGGDRTKIRPELVQSSMTTPGPVVVNIPAGYVFNGVLFFPNSQITIKGTGKIVGFIAARRIIEESPGSRTFVTSQEISMPSLAATRRDQSNVSTTVFDYTRYYVTDHYNLVYSKFVDYTDKKFLD